MKYTFTLIFLLAGLSASQAQLLDKLKDKAEKAAEKVADEVLNTEKTAEEDQSAVGQPEVASGEAPGRALPAFDFIPGDSLIFRDSLLNDPAGKMAGTWKSSGSGRVARFPGVDGNWLLMSEFTTYKLDTLLRLPENFTVEFDLLTRSDQAKDLLEFSFGFASDNSVSSYIGDAHNNNAITETTLHYWNKEIINASSDTDIYNTTDYKLEEYANETMHVSIRVSGKNMAVYLDKDKVLDTGMFDAGAKKYFYMSTGTELNNQAQIAISNFTLRE